MRAGLGISPTYRFAGECIYAEPDPVTVAQVWHSHGREAADERWFWKCMSELQLIRNAGLAIIKERRC